MPYFWITATTGRSGTVKARDKAEAQDIAQRAGSIGQADTLPYAATPYLNDVGDINLCYTPNECKGHTSCPHRYACSE